ncbi:MAG: glutamine synthetase III [Spirochaetia bacterium]|jgi:glutamine synthetase|nr:glutamine synthetase III [Spirochaetia bacterium]
MEEKTIDFTKTPLKELYGENCFNDAVMKLQLPKSTYKELKEVQNGNKKLSLGTAEVVASAMKDWAIEKGATHYTHWFQPMTGLTAEKHDSFIIPTADGKVILEFSGKELIKGEPDASSFPNGGLRTTFEARGYTAWDTTSPAYLMNGSKGVTLRIPCAFFSFTGEALDKKAPLLKSMEVINREALRIIRILGNTTSEKVIPTAGAEQEYFLVDKSFFDRRMDLFLTGRTLFGAMPAKGQELDDHYFGPIKPRVADFMRELNFDLWRLGVAAKTQHNEVAPNQFEIAPVYTTVNVATDHNQLTMEVIQKVANRHNLVALLHEKPFAGLNGSGKHNNWSLSTDDGINLLEPGDNPHQNMRFLIFLSAIIKAVDIYAPLLRWSASNTGNDHRLGANEAPPAIISMFLGSELNDLLEKLSENKPATSTNGNFLELGVSSLPKLPKDSTDRNRTSPFAFTGNKFEFRMVPSSGSISMPNTVLNTVVADILSEFASELEKTDDLTKTTIDIIARTYRNHNRIIFNGNGYAGEWLKEAEKRGLPNIKSTVESIPALVSESSVNLFTKHSIMTKEELESRYAIYLGKYSKQINIEAGVMIDMVKLEIIPAVLKYAGKCAEIINSLSAAGIKKGISEQRETVELMMKNFEELKFSTDLLEKELLNAKSVDEPLSRAKTYHEKVFPVMSRVRLYADALEKMTAKKDWPFPTYLDLLFRI